MALEPMNMHTSIGEPSSCCSSMAGEMSEISVRQATLGVIFRLSIS